MIYTITTDKHLYHPQGLYHERVEVCRYLAWLYKDDPVRAPVSWCHENLQGRPWDWTALKLIQRDDDKQPFRSTIFVFSHRNDAMLFKLAHSGTFTEHGEHASIEEYKRAIGAIGA